jgi:hypothetical protein
VPDSIAACPAPPQVIIFRSCTPLAVTLCDYIFLGREMPSKQSAAALLTIAAGPVRYCRPGPCMRRQVMRPLGIAYEVYG